MVERHFEVRTSQGVIRGMVHEPDVAEMFAPIVFVHGYFSATRVGPARLYVSVARALCRAGSRVYRADALGVGDSDGDFESVTLQTELRDFRYICNYVRNVANCAELILLGHSFGANLSLRLAYGDDRIEKIILLAPATAESSALSKLFSEQQLLDLLSQGSTIRKGLRIDGSFIEDMKSGNSIDLLSEIAKPIAIIHGDRDELYTLDAVRKLVQKAKNVHLDIVAGADHNFSSEDSQSRLLQSLRTTIR